jgi:hypothetical protein
LAGLRRFGQARERVGGQMCLPGARGGLDQLGQRPHGPVPLGFGGSDPGGGILAGLLGGGVPVGFGCDEGGMRLGGAGLGCGQLGGHLLGGSVGLSAPLVGLGRTLLSGGRAGFSSGGTLLGGGADGFHLGFGGGRVCHGLDGLAEPGGDVGDPVGFGVQQAQQFRAGYPGHGHGSVGVGRTGCDPGCSGGQAAAFPPGGDFGVPAAFAVFRGAARPGREGCGLGAAGVLARVPCRGGSGVVGGSHRRCQVSLGLATGHVLTSQVGQLP